MSNWKKLITATTAAVAISASVVGAASANISTTSAVNYVSSTTAPGATVAFGVATNVVTVDTAGPTQYGVGQLWTVGNILTFTLNNGTFAVLPTVSVTGTGCSTTAVYSSGGTGAATVAFQLTGATPVTACSLTLTGVQVNGVTSAAAGSSLTVSLSDQAGALNAVTATSKRTTVASFSAPYTFAFTTTGAANTTVNLSAANPGAQYSGTPTLGTLTVNPVGTALTQWSGTTAPALGSAGATVTVTVPTGPFVSSTINCGGTPVSVTTQTSPGLITFTGLGATAGFPAVTGSSTGCTVALGQTSTSATALLGTGATSGTVSVPVDGTVQATFTGNGNFQAITFAGGTSVNAGYVTGDSANYNSFISVTTGATSGPVIVQGTADGVTLSGTLATTQAARTNALYTLAQVRTALGLGATGSFATDGNRGSLTVVVPTGSLVAPLLLNRSNGQVVEMSRQ